MWAIASFAGMFAIGTIYGLMYREFVISPKKEKLKPQKNNKNKEVNRDLIQIFLGIILIAVIYFIPHLAAIDLIFALIILAYACNNLLANLKLGPIYKKAVDLERKNVTYGLGATYLAASTALVMGFTHSTNMLLFAIIVLFFADSFATIVGVSLKRAAELPYNRYKTIVGSFAFFVVAAVAGFVLLGYFGILFALILSFVESLNHRKKYQAWGGCWMNGSGGFGRRRKHRCCPMAGYRWSRKPPACRGARSMRGCVS